MLSPPPLSLRAECQFWKCKNLYADSHTLCYLFRLAVYYSGNGERISRQNPLRLRKIVSGTADYSQFIKEVKMAANAHVTRWLGSLVLCLGLKRQCLYPFREHRYFRESIYLYENLGEEILPWKSAKISYHQYIFSRVADKKFVEMSTFLNFVSALVMLSRGSVGRCTEMDVLIKYLTTAKQVLNWYCSLMLLLMWYLSMVIDVIKYATVPTCLSSLQWRLYHLLSKANKGNLLPAVNL